MAEQGRLLVGEIVGAQGIGGQLRVRSFTQDPADLVAYGPVIADPDPAPSLVNSACLPSSARPRILRPGWGKRGTFPFSSPSICPARN